MSRRPMDLSPHELPPLPPPEAALRPLPALGYFLFVAGLYVALGSIAQAWFLPLGIWWSQIFLFFLPTALALRARGFKPLRFLRFDRLPARGQILPAAATALAVFFSASALMSACEDVAPARWVEHFDISRVLDTVHGPWQAVLFASVVVGAPLAEETVFRGYLQPAIAARTGLPRAILIQALLFSLVHMDPIGFLPRLLLGVCFGELVALTGSLWTSVFAHALNNGISTVLFFLYGPGPAGEAAPQDPRWALLLSLVAGALVYLLLVWLRRATPAAPPEPTADPSARTAEPPRAQSFGWAAAWSAAVVFGLAALRLCPKP
ncbi:MAG: CPBP family intramembrane glutamic endopeptidase [Myxococcales bacterium]